MLEITDIYNTPTWIVAVMFAGVTVWAGLAALYFWHSFAAYSSWSHPADRSTRTAFALGIGLWAAFLVADEFFLTYLTYDVGSVHVRLFVAQIVSLLAVALLPD